MTRRLAFLLALLCGAAPLRAQFVCTGAGCGGGSGTVTSPIATDPLSVTGVVTFNNAANTPLTCSDGLLDSTLTAGRVTFAGASGRLSDDADFTFATDTATMTKGIGSTSLCAVGAIGAANSVCVSSNTITGEGATADSFNTRIVFGDAPAQRDLYVTAQAGAGTVRLATASSPTSFIDIRGSDVLIGSASVGHLALRSDANIGIDASVQVVFAGASDPTSSASVGFSRPATGIIKVTNGSSGGGDLQIGTGILTASTMTSESTALSRDVVSSYTWSNAQVAALAGTAGDINVATLPAKTQVLDALVVITGAAAGPTTVTVSCGDAIGGTPFINYVVASDAKAAANTVYGDALAERGTSLDTELWYLPSYTATTLVTCHFISTGANLSTVTGSTGRVILMTRLLP